MRKAEIVRRIMDETELTQAKTEEAVNAILNEIKRALAQGDFAILRGFGTFQVRDKGARPGRNPATGEAASITPRRVVLFKAGTRLKAAANTCSKPAE